MGTRAHVWGGAGSVHPVAAVCAALARGGVECVPAGQAVEEPTATLVMSDDGTVHALEVVRRTAAAGVPVVALARDAARAASLLAAGACEVVHPDLTDTVLAARVEAQQAAHVHRAAVEASRTGTWVASARMGPEGLEGDVSQVYSDSLRELLGYSRAEFPDTFEAWLKIMHDDDRVRVLASLEAHLAHGRPYLADQRLLRRDGTWGWFRARGRAVREGGRVRMAGTLVELPADGAAGVGGNAELVAGLPVGAVHVEGDSIHPNDAALRLTGHTAGDLASLAGWFRLLFGAEATAAREQYEKERANGFPAPMMLSITRKDGARRAVEFRGAGDVRQAVWIVRDMTEDLRESRLYRTLASSIPEAAVGLFDPQLRFLLVEGPELDILGLDRAQLFQHRPDDVLVPGVATPLLDAMRGALEGHSPGRGTLKVEDRVYDLTAVPVYAGRGEVLGGLILVQNVTGRARAVEALQASRERYRALLDGIPDVVMRVDADLMCTDIHVPPGRAPGLAPPQEVGHRVLDLVSEPSRAGLETALRRTLAHGTGESTEYTLQATDGRQRTFEARTVRSGPAEVTVISRDITDLKSMQQRLMVTERMATVGTLAAGVTHEINNPLAYVTGNLQFLEDDLQALLQKPAGEVTPTALRGMLQDMLAGVKDALHGTGRVNQIVQDLRVFSRVETDQVGPVDLGRVIQTCLKMASSEIRHRAQVVVETEAVPPVRGSEGRLGQVILNLLVNAAQAIPEGRPDVHRIHVRTSSRPDGRVGLEVADTGRGMPPEVLARVFDPFYTTRPIGEGMGMGLSICHGIVTSLGGDIQVESTPGAGSTFRVALPAWDPPPARGVPPAPRRTALPAARGRILVIDDDPRVGLGLQRMLGSAYRVEIQLGAAGALARLKEGQKYDLILCDLIMPQRSGMDFHDEVSRHHPEHLKCLAFMTGGAFTARARDFLRTVKEPTVEKPFGREEFAALLQRVMDGAAEG